VIADQNGLLSAQTASAAIFTTQQVVSTAGQTTFPITNGYATGYVTVFVNGTKLSADEYVDTSGTNIIFLTGSTAGDVVEFQKYLPASGVSNNTLRTVNYFTATLGQTNFNVNYTPGLLDVFYNGAKLDNTEYTAANGTSITLATGSNAGDRLEVDVYSYQVGAFSGIGGTGAANQIAYYNTTNSITGSNAFTVSGSAIIITGSLIVSGSGTFTNIGPAVFSGSVTAVGGFSGSFSGNADSASLAQNSLLLQGTGSIGFATTASLLAVSSSQQQISASLLNVIANYATTGSNSFRANQSITGSLVVSSTITAQTLVVQTVTSSIVYSSGSNIFGSALGDRQTFTGSVNITGSITQTGANVTSSFVGNININGNINILNYSASLPAAALMISGAISAIGLESKFAYGTWTDPAVGVIYDVKLGGNQNGIAVRGTSFFSGSVGIGTISPAKKLDVYDTNGNSTSQIKLRNAGTTTAAYLGQFSETLYLSSGGSYNSGWSADGTNAISAIAMAAGNGDSSIAFQTTTSNGSGPLTRMYITNSGSVGIGTTVPLSTLHQVGGGAFYTADVRFGGSSTQFGVEIRYDQGSATSGSIYCSPGYSSNGILFRLGAGSGNTNQLVLTGAGNIGINTSSPNGNHKLEVNGAVAMSGINLGNMSSLGSLGSTVLYLPITTGAIAFRSSNGATGYGYMTADTANIIFSTPIKAPGECQFYYGSYIDPGPGTAYDAKFGGNGGGGIAVRGNSVFVGSVSKGGGSFRIDHPLPAKKDTHFLLHSFIEGPTPDLIYRGVVTLVDGTATINIDEVSDMTEGTFILLNKRVQCFTTNESGWDLTKGKVEGNILTITSQNSESTDEISWMVVGERQDEWMRNSDMTDEDGKIIVEKLKPTIEE